MLLTSAGVTRKLAGEGMVGRWSRVRHKGPEGEAERSR